MNNSPSDLMSYYLWAKKKNFEYNESIGDYFYGAILYNRDFYVFSYTIGDALREPIEDALIFQGDVGQPRLPT